MRRSPHDQEIQESPSSEPAQESDEELIAGIATPTAEAVEPMELSHNSVKRLGLYFQQTEFNSAKAAYLADWQRGGEADTFPTWITSILEEHAARTPQQRTHLARLQERSNTRGIARSFEIPEAAMRRVKLSIVADQNAGRWTSMNAWAGDAIAAAVARAQGRGPLPTPPARLPNRLTR